MDLKGDSGEIASGTEEYLFGNCNNGDPRYKVAKNLAESCSSVLWKIEVKSDELVYLAEKMSKQSVEDGTWFLHTAYSKTREDSDQ